MVLYLPKDDPLGLVFAIAAKAKSNTVVGVLPKISVSTYNIVIYIKNQKIQYIRVIPKVFSCNIYYLKNKLQ